MTGDRAVSSAMGYILVMAIALALVAGLVLGTEALVQDQREEAVRGQLEVVGQQLAATIMNVDRFNATEAVPETASTTRQFPDRVAGSQYHVAVVVDDAASGRYTLYLDAVDSGVNVTVPVRMDETDLGPTRIDGGTIRVAYDGTADEVVIERA